MIKAGDILIAKRDLMGANKREFTALVGYPIVDTDDGGYKLCVFNDLGEMVWIVTEYALTLFTLKEAPTEAKSLHDIYTEETGRFVCTAHDGSVLDGLYVEWLESKLMAFIQ